jgi:hypothetical protein
VSVLVNDTCGSLTEAHSDSVDEGEVISELLVSVLVNITCGSLTEAHSDSVDEGEVLRTDVLLVRKDVSEVVVISPGSSGLAPSALPMTGAAVVFVVVVSVSDAIIVDVMVVRLELVGA